MNAMVIKRSMSPLISAACLEINSLSSFTMLVNINNCEAVCSSFDYDVYIINLGCIAAKWIKPYIDF
jgi:hypothetical protein